MKERDDRVYGEDSFGLNLYPASGEGSGVQICIPGRQLGVGTAPGGVWKLNFRRKQSRYESYAAWQLPWSYSPASSGKLTLH